MKDTKSDRTIAGEIKKGVDDVKDAVDETLHRSAAEAEKTRREVAGEEMTPGEKLTSGVREAKDRVKAEVDKAKREIRDNT